MNPLESTLTKLVALSSPCLLLLVHPCLAQDPVVPATTGVVTEAARQPDLSRTDGPARSTAGPSTEITANAPPANPDNGNINWVDLLSAKGFSLSAIILVFGLVVVVAEYKFLQRPMISSEQALNIFPVTLIIIGTLFIITAGYDVEKIAPAMGLMGTIAGYLVGQRSVDRPSGAESARPAPQGKDAPATAAH